MHYECCGGLVNVVFTCICIFNFKQKTAYEVRISDWSSDVCSSDLLGSLADAVQYLEDRDTNTGKGRHDLPFPLSPTGRDAPMLTELPRGPHKPLASRDKQTSISTGSIGRRLHSRLESRLQICRDLSWHMTLQTRVDCQRPGRNRRGSLREIGRAHV